MKTEPRQRQVRTDGCHLPQRKSTRRQSAPRDKAERIADLIFLLADGREWAARELSAKLKVTVRTVHRDMQLLESKGLAWRTTRRYGGNPLLPETTWEQPRLSSAELIGLLIVAAREPSDDVASLAALATVIKIARLQRKNTRRRLLPIAELIQSQPRESRQWLCCQPWLAILLEGLAESRPVSAWVPDAPGLPQPTLEVMPHALAVAGGEWVLQAHHVSPPHGEITVELKQVVKIAFASQSP